MADSRGRQEKKVGGVGLFGYWNLGKKKGKRYD